MGDVVPDLLEKPAYGSPCNGCGLCCIAVQCPLSTALFGEQEICPALMQVRGGNTFGCGLLIDISRFVPDMSAWGNEALPEAFALMMGAGVGCDGTVEGETRDEAAWQRMLAISEARLGAASPSARALVAYFRGAPAPQSNN